MGGGKEVAWAKARKWHGKGMYLAEHQRDGIPNKEGEECWQQDGGDIVHSVAPVSRDCCSEHSNRKLSENEHALSDGDGDEDIVQTSDQNPANNRHELKVCANAVMAQCNSSMASIGV